MTNLTTEERVDRLEEALLQLATATGHVSMNGSATRRGRVAEIIAEREEV